MCLWVCRCWDYRACTVCIWLPECVESVCQQLFGNLLPWNAKKLSFCDRRKAQHREQALEILIFQQFVDNAAGGFTAHSAHSSVNSVIPAQASILPCLSLTPTPLHFPSLSFTHHSSGSTGIKRLSLFCETRTLCAIQCVTICFCHDAPFWRAYGSHG